MNRRSEKIGLIGEQLGQLPQAFTHPAFVDPGIALTAELDRRPSRPVTGARLEMPRAPTPRSPDSVFTAFPGRFFVLPG